MLLCELDMRLNLRDTSSDTAGAMAHCTKRFSRNVRLLLAKGDVDCDIFVKNNGHYCRGQRQVARLRWWIYFSATEQISSSGTRVDGRRFHGLPMPKRIRLFDGCSKQAHICIQRTA
jgi:hypothetical protein